MLKLGRLSLVLSALLLSGLPNGASAQCVPGYNCGPYTNRYYAPPGYRPPSAPPGGYYQPRYYQRQPQCHQVCIYRIYHCYTVCN